jgi:hypothetical protein
MANNDRCSSSNNNKRRNQDPENTIIIPLFFHINSYTMSSNADQNNYDSERTDEDPPRLSSETLNHLNTSHIDPSAPGSDDMLTLLLEGEVFARQGANRENPNQSPLPMSTPAKLRIAEEILAGPSNPPTLARSAEGEELR